MITDQQALAIETRNVSILLSSGAGCGKTHVLTARYLSHLEHDSADVGQIVAITFTERAAREMRNRIRETITERVRAAPSLTVRKRWVQRLRDLESAPITTIHSFCGNLLRQFAVQAGLDPQFQILDDVLAGNIKAEATATALRELLTAHREAGDDLRELVVLYGWNATVTAIERLVSEPDPPAWSAWLERSPESITDEWLHQRRPELLPRWVEYLQGGVPKIANCLNLLRTTPCSGPLMKANVERILDQLPRLHEIDDLHAAVAEISEYAKVGKERDKAWPDKEIYERIRDTLSDFRKALPEKMTLFTDEVDDPSPSAVWGKRFLRVATEVAEAYQNRKRIAGVVDFQDLLARTRELLRTHPDIQESLRQRFRFVLVDEFQDTDPIQIELVEQICGVGLEGGALFAVGDQKQSIYRFRGADVELFRGLRSRLPNEGRLGLTLNFRSQQGVIDFVNGLCRHRFTDYEPLEAFHQPENAHACVTFLWSVPGPESPGKESVAEIRQREADAIARHLLELIESRQQRIWDATSGTFRPIELKDVAVLFRSMSHVAIYESALRRRGLDYYLVGGRAFFAQQEIYDLLSLLRTIENPTDTVSLVGTLRSPFCCLSDEAIFGLAQHQEGIWAGLHDWKWHERVPESQRTAVERASRFFRRWRSRKDHLSISRLLGEIFADAGYDAAMLFEFLGERKLANLWKLQELARSFDRTGLFGLADFIARLGELVRTQPREEQAATMPENADVIKLMSIHQSKGLEFPVVVIADIAAGQRGDVLPAAVWHRSFGCLVRPPTDEEPPPFSDHAWKLGRSADAVADWEEELRVLYVACTRARDQLILSAGWPSDAIAHDRHLNPRNSWTLALAERFDLFDGQYRHRDQPDGQTPHVNVCWQEPCSDDTVFSRRPQSSITESVEEQEWEPASVEEEYIDSDQWPIWSAQKPRGEA